MSDLCQRSALLAGIRVSSFILGLCLVIGAHLGMFKVRRG